MGTAVKYGQPAVKPQPSADLPPQALHVSRVGFSENFGHRSAGESRTAVDMQHGSGGNSAGSAANAQAAAGYNALNLGLNILNKMVKK